MFLKQTAPVMIHECMQLLLTKPCGQREGLECDSTFGRTPWQNKRTVDIRCQNINVK